MIHCVGTEDLEPGGNFAMGRKGQFLRGSPVGLRVCQLGSIHGPPCHQCEEHLGGELVWFSRPADLGPQRWVLCQDSWRFILREVVPFGRMKEVPRQVVAHPLGAGRLKWLKPGPDIHQDTSTKGAIRRTPCPRSVGLTGKHPTQSPFFDLRWPFRSETIVPVTAPPWCGNPTSQAGLGQPATILGTTGFTVSPGSMPGGPEHRRSGSERTAACCPGGPTPWPSSGS